MSSLAVLLPFDTHDIELGPGTVGLVVVDPGVAFTREGSLADAVSMKPMVDRIDAEVKALRDALGDRLRVLVFLDTHHADIPEPPYPPHGIIGTGEELIDPTLHWMMEEPWIQLIRKDCINGFVGAIDRSTGRNAFCDWVIDQGVDELVVTGDCTDICVSDFVVSTLSARNHGLLTREDPIANREQYVADITSLRVAVLEPACATFHAPGFHDGPTAHHVGLWLMAARGATIAKSWS
jgi:nicotinamidase-related amidase